MENIKTTYDAANKIWRGINISRNYGSDYSLGRAALEAMLKSPTKIGQICYHNGRSFTNKELATLTISVAHHFTKLRLKQCDVIGICASNTDFLAPLFFGAMLKGIIVSSLDASYDKEGIKHTFSMTKPKIMFCDGGIYERVKEALQEIGLNSTQIYTMKDHMEGVSSINEFLTHKSENLNYSFEPLKLGLSQTAAILCSSGTTGLPKGVTMSNEDLLDFEFYKLTAADRMLCFSTLHWLTGLYTLVRGTLNGFTRIINDKAFSTDDFFDIVEKYRVTVLLTPPSQMAMILASSNLKTADLSSIQIYLCGGSAVSFAVAKQLKEFMPNAKFYNGYGMSESRCAIALGELINNTRRVGEMGQNMEIKIVDDDGKRLGPNEVGEFCFKTPNKWFGYYGNEQATAAAYDKEGWITTGDLGFMDDQGNLYVVDRKKDILKYNNFHYFPTEIEQVIHELDDVVEVCVCGLPDLVSTDLPAAAVVKKIGSNLTEQEIYEHVAQKMAHFKHLRGGVYFFDKMPLTATGKILRSEVKKICDKLRNEKKERKLQTFQFEITTL